MTDDVTRALHRSIQRAHDRAAVGTVAAESGPWATPEEVLDSVREVIERHADTPSLLMILARPEWVAELRALLAKAAPDAPFPAVIGEVEIVEREQLAARWIMVWSDAHRVCDLDGKVYRIERQLVLPGLNLPPLAAPSRFEFDDRLTRNDWSPRMGGPYSPVVTAWLAGLDIRLQPGRAPRRKDHSKGWRKHVRRQKALQRRGTVVR